MDRRKVLDVSDVVHDLGVIGQKFGRGVIRLALARTLTRTARSGRVAGVREIQRTYNIKTKDLRQGRKGSAGATGITPATRTNLTATIFTTGKPIPIKNFGARQNKKGTSVMIRKGSRKTIPHAFFATMPKKGGADGYRGVFARGTYKADGFHHGKSRLPINKLYGVSQGVMFGEEGVLERTLERVDDMFMKRLVHEIDFIVSGIIAKTAGRAGSVLPVYY